MDAMILNLCMIATTSVPVWKEPGMKITWRKMPPRDARTYTEAFLVVTHCGAPQKDILKKVAARNFRSQAGKLSIKLSSFFLTPKWDRKNEDTNPPIIYLFLDF